MYHGKVTGVIFPTVEAMLEAERHEIMKRSRPDGTRDLNSISPAELRTFIEDESLSNKQREARAHTQAIGDAFSQLHGEYIDNKRNGETMKHAFGLLGIVNPSLSQFEEVYEKCKVQGLLELNQKVINEQYALSARTYAEEVRAASIMPSEEELYSMPLEEIRRRAGGGSGGGKW
jgi:hypothetical protein